MRCSGMRCDAILSGCTGSGDIEGVSSAEKQWKIERKLVENYEKIDENQLKIGRKSIPGTLRAPYLGGMEGTLGMFLEIQSRIAVFLKIMVSLWRGHDFRGFGGPAAIALFQRGARSTGYATAADP